MPAGILKSVVNWGAADMAGKIFLVIFVTGRPTSMASHFSDFGVRRQMLFFFPILPFPDSASASQSPQNTSYTPTEKLGGRCRVVETSAIILQNPGICINTRIYRSSKYLSICFCTLINLPLMVHLSILKPHYGSNTYTSGGHTKCPGNNYLMCIRSLHLN